MDSNDQSFQDEGYASNFATAIGAKKLIIFAVIPIFTVFFILSFTLYSFRNALTQDVSGATTVTPRSIYENPFEKNEQYENPFYIYKNPIANAKSK